MRVLVVEDETKVGCFIKRALEEESYAVDLCEDGAKGLEMALATNYDLIVVDLMLPSMSGSSTPVTVTFRSAAIRATCSRCR